MNSPQTTLSRRDMRIVSDIYDGRTRVLFEHQCAKCGLAFYAPKKADAKYCSLPCAQAASRKRIDAICSQCTKTFSRKISRVGKHPETFCSRACKDLGQSLKGNCPRIRPGHYGSPNSYRNRIILDKCVGCGETRRFLLLTHHIDGNRRHNQDENLECVCFNCHVIRHLRLVDSVWKYSTKHLTPRDVIAELTWARSSAGEHLLCKQGAVSSILIASTKIAA